jgi:hypothetical protein
MKIDNQQLQDLSNEQLQVLLSAKLGDGCYHTNKWQKDYRVTITTTHKEYHEYRLDKLKRLVSSEYKHNNNRGFSTNKPVYILTTGTSKIYTGINNLSIEETVKKLDDIGIALWFYDDGSLHKKLLFYNLNTQAFSREIQEDIFIPFFKERNMKAVLQVENKIDGRKYYYLRFPKNEGCAEISKILQKIPLNCFKYKTWSSETIQRWSKVQENLKSEGIDIYNYNPRSIGWLMKKVSI